METIIKITAIARLRMIQNGKDCGSYNLEGMLLRLIGALKCLCLHSKAIERYIYWLFSIICAHLTLLYKISIIIHSLAQLNK